MVNTFLTEEDQALKHQFEQFAFAKEKPAPFASEPAAYATNFLPFLKQLAQAGYLAFNVPVNYGGKDAPFLHLVLLAEMSACYGAGIAVHLAYHAALIELLKAYGSEQQKANYLPKLAKGELLGTLAYLETSTPDTPTKILPQEGQLFLDGSKQLVLLNPDYIPNLIAVLADDHFVLLNNLSASTIKINAQNFAMEPKSIYLSNLIFQRHSVSAGDILTNTKINTDAAIKLARDIIKTILAAAALGMADNALHETTKYVGSAQSAQTAGKPLSQSQAVLWKLADASTDTSAARLLIYRAAWSKDEDKESFSRYAAMAKAYAAKKANQHIGEGLQILLPFMQTEYFDLSRLYIDSKIIETFDATNEEEKVLLSRLLGI